MIALLIEGLPSDALPLHGSLVPSKMLSDWLKTPLKFEEGQGAFDQLCRVAYEVNGISADPSEFLFTSIS